MSIPGPVSEASGASADLEGLPWPEGDPGGLRHGAARLSAASERVRGAGGQLTSASTSAASWQGMAAASFQTAVVEEVGVIQASADALDQAAPALQRLAVVVEDAQAEVRDLAAQVRQAEEEAQAAVARAAVLQAVATATGTALALAGNDPPPALRASATAAGDQADAAQASAGGAQERAEAVRALATTRAEELCNDVLREDRATAELVQAAAAAAPLGGTRPLLGTPSQRFVADAFYDLTPEQWQQLALWRAGIDPATWDPSRGLLANDQNVQAVYEYYSQLWLEHPELQWAGMAAVAGALFYGQWQDLYALRQVAEDDRIEYMLESAGLPDLPGEAWDVLGGAGVLIPGDFVGDLASGELSWFENRFLSMQQAIFSDLAWKHEAYIYGGLPAMESLYDQGSLTTTEIGAWRDIASGDADRVFDGNEELLRREQHDIIQRDWDAIADHGMSGWALTQYATWTGESPMPGGEPYRYVVGHEYEINLPTPDVELRTDPFGIGPSLEIYDVPDIHLADVQVPDGNIANFDDRWQWIQEDMLPAYRELLSDPEAMSQLVGTPVAERADDFRQFGFLDYPGGQ